MYGWYKVVLQAWPYSTGNGQARDQEVAGPRVRHHALQAPDFPAAYAAALQYQAGVLSSGHVYHAPITSVEYVGAQRPVLPDPRSA